MLDCARLTKAERCSEQKLRLLRSVLLGSLFGTIAVWRFQKVTSFRADDFPFLLHLAGDDSTFIDHRRDGVQLNVRVAGKITFTDVRRL